jgi:phospholipid transport system substrate-binding protein
MSTDLPISRTARRMAGGLNRSRRTVLAFAVATALLPRFVWAQSPDQAASLVKATATQLVSIVNAPGSLDDKRTKMRGVIEASVDVEGVGRFALGRYGRTASAQQQKEYGALFHDVLLNNITSRIGEYKGVAVTMGDAQQRDDGVHVMTVVTRPNNPPANVAWVVSSVGGKPKIIDLLAEGTSMRLTQRSDYASYLAHHNNEVQALIDAMRQQTASIR